MQQIQHVVPLELTFRFDDESNSLNRFNGLPIDLFATFLKALSEAVGVKHDHDLVVSEIKGNCYAPVLSTSSATKFAEIKVLHEEISKNNYSNLNQKQKNYAKTLKTVLGNRFYLDVYDLDKKYFKNIKEIKIEDKIKHYYESTSVRGTVTRIGGKSLESKPKILISNYNHDIEISNEQDESLKEHYKKGVLEFYIVQKINVETNNIESTLLEDFIHLDNSNDSMRFPDIIKKISSQYGESISEYLNSIQND